MHVKIGSGPNKKRLYRRTVVIADNVTGEFCCTSKVRSVVPNRGAAAPWGAIYSAQGCRGLTRFFTISLKIYFQAVIKPQSNLLWVP